MLARVGEQQRPERVLLDQHQPGQVCVRPVEERHQASLRLRGEVSVGRADRGGEDEDLGPRLHRRVRRPEFRQVGAMIAPHHADVGDAQHQQRAEKHRDRRPRPPRNLELDAGEDHQRDQHRQAGIDHRAAFQVARRQDVDDADADQRDERPRIRLQELPEPDRHAADCDHREDAEGDIIGGERRVDVEKLEERALPPYVALRARQRR
ncbi:MAG: hypothetical protein WDM84_06515 [Bauldia sp.]